MTNEKNLVSVFGLVPAAGLSRRMGTAKQALPYKNSTVTGSVTQTMLNAKLEAVVVVTRSELIEKIGLPDDQRVIIAINDDPDSQMMDSIMLGLRTIDEVSIISSTLTPTAGVLVIPGDMPTVSSHVCRQCVEVFKKDPTRIVIATAQGNRGHPMIFPFSLRPHLESMSAGLNELPRSHAHLVSEVDVNTTAILRDVDTPTDYENLSS